MVKPNYTAGVGGLATSRYDFENHILGTAFRHNADQIDVNPPFDISGIDYVTVSASLDAIANFIVVSQSNGQGFITIGDGYDTYHASDSSGTNPNVGLPWSRYPYDSTIPALNTALDDLLNNPLNPLYHRIRDGGIIVIKAGTYKFTGTVNVPPGIMIFGESYGTKIANATSGAPLFRIKTDTSRSADSGSDTVKFMFARETVFYNLTVADNFIEPLYLGDLSYKIPINTSASNPLIIQEPGSNLRIQNCKFIGKPVIDIVSSHITTCTSMVVGTDTTIPVATGSHLVIDNCFIDGFSETCQFKTTGYTNDTFVCTNNKIRNYGNLNVDSSGHLNNTFFNINRCNAIITGNYANGTLTGYISSLLYVDNFPAFVSTSTQPRITVSNNTGAMYHNAFYPVLVYYNPGSDGENVMESMASGNNFGFNATYNYINYNSIFGMNGLVSVGGLDGYTSNLSFYNNSNLVLNSGSTLMAASGSTIAFDAGSSTTFASSSSLALNGTATVSGTETIASGGELQLLSGSEFDGYSGSVFKLHTGCSATMSLTNSNITINNSSILETAGTGFIQTNVAGSFVLAGGSTDYPTFSTPRTRTIQYVPAQLVTYLGTDWALGVFFSTNIPSLTGHATSTQLCIPLLNPINGSTLTSLTMHVAVASAHASVPAILPVVRVFRVTIAAPYVSDYMDSGSGQAFTPTPGSGAAWYDSGNDQSWTYTTNQSNVIDTSQYNYYVQIVDENGANSHNANQYSGFTVLYSNIVDMRPA